MIFRCAEVRHKTLKDGAAADLPDPANLILKSTSGSLAGDEPQLGPLCSGGCSSTTIDLAIFYTQNTVLGTGSPLIVEALCELGVLQANTGFENSASTTRVRIVYLGQVDYDDSVESGHLDHLVNPDDDYMDEVQDIMQAASADVASLIVEYDEGWCGVAYLFILRPSAVPRECTILSRRLRAGARTRSQPGRLSRRRRRRWV